MSDNAESSRKVTKRLERERQAILASIVHQPSAVRISDGGSNSPHTSTGDQNVGVGDPSSNHASSQVPTPTDTATSATKRKVRGKSTLCGIGSSQEKKPRVEFDENDHPIGKIGKKYNSALPIIVRELVPVTIRRWNTLLEQFGDELWEAIQLRFNVDDSASRYSFQKMGAAWRTYKSILTSDVLKVGKNTRNLQLMKPHNVPTMEEWLSFARQRLSKEHAKEMSDAPDSITRVDVWIKAHKRKDKSYINEAAKEAAEQREEYTNTTQSTGIHDDAISHVMGPEHRGRVRALGFGVTMTKINAQNDVSRKYDRTIGSLEQQLQRQQQIQLKMQQQIKALME
ncbi:uncharacterized protein LOC132304979 [Cornus florida]|uniref:uncharacterized protein LOC132304979 n=1 Tax=Cornus florida TaxID=4283 RepID=UPI002896D30E|nr:uncharacterized protein LOC132304979 [Cornus florida]